MSPRVRRGIRNASTSSCANAGQGTDTVSLHASDRHSDLFRDQRGRFTLRGARCVKNVRRAIQQRESVRRKLIVKKTIFEKYLHAFFLRGNNDDILHPSRSAGPLVQIFDAIITPGMRLGKPERYILTRQYFLDDGHLRDECGARLEGSRGTTGSCSRSAKPKRYRGCRLPNVSMRMTEMVKVKEAVEFAHRKKALAYSVDECMRKIIEMIEAHNEVRVGSQSNPITGSSQSALCSDCINALCSGCRGLHPSESAGEQNPSSSNQREADLREPQGDQEPSGGPSATATARGSDDDTSRGAGADIQEPEEQPAVPGSDVSNEDRERCKKREAVLATAKVHKNYVVLCMLFDDLRNIEVGTYCREFTKRLQQRQLVPTRLMAEVLLFVQARRDGKVDSREHRERERNLRLTMNLFHLARKSVGLRLYSDMQWEFLQENSGLQPLMNELHNLLNTLYSTA